MSTQTASDTNDSAPRLLAGGPDPIRQMRTPHWVGITALAGAIVVAAIVIPPQLTGPESAPVQAPPGVAAGSTATPTGAAPPSPTASGSRSSESSTPGGPAPAPESAPGSDPSPRGPAAGPDPDPSRADPPAGPKPTPSPSRSAAGSGTFRPISVQAEDPGNVLGGGAKVTSCSGCDGGARVRYLGTLTVPIEAASAGRRTITVHYTCDGARDLTVAVNGGTPTVQKVTGTDWETPQTFRFTATVPAGRSTLAVLDGGPDIDKITIS